MRTLILCVVVLCVVVVGVTSYAAGQARPGLVQKANIVYGPSTSVTANTISHDDATRTTYARGQVRITSDASTITADEADLHHLNDTKIAVDLAIELRGNVRVVIAPPR